VEFVRLLIIVCCMVGERVERKVAIADGRSVGKNDGAIIGASVAGFSVEGIGIGIIVSLIKIKTGALVVGNMELFVRLLIIICCMVGERVERKVARADGMFVGNVDGSIARFSVEGINVGNHEGSGVEGSAVVGSRVVGVIVVGLTVGLKVGEGVVGAGVGN